jgi:1,4-dihydroxy-2-naphthoate octaprenyltransferase
MASRPRTLPAALAPVIVGAAVAAHDGVFQPLPVLAALCAAILIQIGSNFANDLGDYGRGTDRVGRVGPTRVTTAGLLTPGQVKTGMWAVFGLAALCGLYLIALGGWPILVAGVVAIVAAISYTAGPLPFGYYGLGDLAVFIFFGLVAVLGTYYVQALVVTSLAFWVAVPMGCLVTAILVVNNLRDADTDRAAGKRTLAVILGRRGARIEYIVLIAIAYLTPLFLWLGLGSSPIVLLPLLTLPLAIRLIRTILRVLGPPLNRALAGTAQLAVWYALALALGLVLAR